MTERPKSALVAIGLVLALGMLSPSCGGDGNGGGTNIVATFTATSPNPGPASATMQPGTSAGTLFRIRIVVTDVADFFGAAFRVSYDTDDIRFESMDSSESFLRDGGFPPASLRFQVDSTSSPGQLILVATRLDAATNPGVNVAGQRELLELTFRARRVVAGSAIGFTGTLEARNSQQPPPEGQLINLTWSGGSLTAN